MMDLNVCFYGEILVKLSQLSSKLFFIRNSLAEPFSRDTSKFYLTKNETVQNEMSSKMSKCVNYITATVTSNLFNT